MSCSPGLGPTRPRPDAVHVAYALSVEGGGFDAGSGHWIGTWAAAPAPEEGVFGSRWGADTVHRDLVAELRALEKAGHRASEAVQACTGWAADVLRLPLLGRVESGKVADLAAVEGDPLADIAAVGRVWGVMQAGASGSRSVSVLVRLVPLRHVGFARAILSCRSDSRVRGA